MSTIEKSASVPSLSPIGYTRRRMLVSLGLFVMAFLTFFIQTRLVESPMQNLSHALGLSIQEETAHDSSRTASARVVRVDSTSHDQYYTTYQWQVWGYASCSGIAMETVMNAYGRHLIAADVLQEEIKLGVWDTQLGLLREEGIAMTADAFGFHTDMSHTRTVQDIVSIANSGKPIIVSVRDNFYYPGGHLFVVRGGDSQYLYIIDSSPGDFQRMSYALFEEMWQGSSAVLTPRT